MQKSSIHLKKIQTLLKALDISSAAAWAVPALLKTLAVISDATVRRSAVDREDLKPYWKLERGTHSSSWSTNLSFTSFLKILLSREKRLPGEQFLVVVLSPKFWYSGDQTCDLLKIWKTRFLQIHFEDLTRITTKIQSELKVGCDFFIQPGSYINIMQIMQILCRDTLEEIF